MHDARCGIGASMMLLMTTIDESSMLAVLFSTEVSRKIEKARNISENKTCLSKTKTKN